MDARFLDGRSARVRSATVEIVDQSLTIAVDGTTHVWPLAGLSVVRQGGEARLSHRTDRDARLVMAVDDWTRLSGAQGTVVERRGRGREVRLVVGLTAFAVSVAAFVFVGVPALSGPMARATPVSFEQRMGQNFDGQMGAIFPDCTGEEGQAILAALGDRIAAQADTPFDVRVRAVQAPMLNAFALPGGPILITDDLIRDAKSPDELAAVVAHEVAHIEKRHVMQAVWRSLGVGLLLDAVVGGGTGAGQQAVILAGQATDLRYGRDAESEADARGQQLLHDLGLSSRGMASFFWRLGGEQEEGDQALTSATEFLSTHPDSTRRAKAARAAERTGAPALTAQEWATVQATCETGSDNPIDSLKRRFGLGGDDAAPDQGQQMRMHGQTGRRP